MQLNFTKSFMRGTHHSKSQFYTANYFAKIWNLLHPFFRKAIFLMKSVRNSTILTLPSWGKKAFQCLQNLFMALAIISYVLSSCMQIWRTKMNIVTKKVTEFEEEWTMDVWHDSLVVAFNVLMPDAETQILPPWFWKCHMMTLNLGINICWLIIFTRSLE